MWGKVRVVRKSENLRMSETCEKKIEIWEKVRCVRKSERKSERCEEKGKGVLEKVRNVRENETH